MASPHALASGAGVDVLRAGGSAVDAAIATSAVLAVVYPHMSGIGGDAFWLIYDARPAKLRYLNGGGRAAAAATDVVPHARGSARSRSAASSPATLTAPGAVASWIEAHARYGRLPLARVPAGRDRLRARRLPGHRAPVARWIAQTRDRAGRSQPRPPAFSCPAATVPRAGSKLVNPRSRAHAGGDRGRAAPGFYEGEVAEEMARFAQRRRRLLPTRTIFAPQRATGASRSRGTYRGVTIYETPPPTQGFTVLRDAQSARAVRLARRRPSSAPTTCICWCRRSRSRITIATGCSPTRDFADVPVERLISKAYARRAARAHRPARARCRGTRCPSYGSLAGDTVYVAAVDATATRPL